MPTLTTPHVNELILQENKVHSHMSLDVDGFFSYLKKQENGANLNKHVIVSKLTLHIHVYSLCINWS